VKLAAALEIDHGTVAALIQADRKLYLENWNRWADVPIRPSLILGHIGGFCWGEPIPEGLTREAAEQHASTVAKDMKRRVCLVLSRRLSIWFDPEGNRTSVNEECATWHELVSLGCNCICVQYLFRVRVF
jgi:hypothetical protein